MIFTLFAIYSWPFWFLLLCLICADIWAIEGKEDAGLVTALTLGFIAILLLATDWRPWHSITFGEVLGYGLIYLAIGFVYAFAMRWSVYVIDKTKAFRPEYAKLKDGFSADHEYYTPATSERKKFESFDDYLRAVHKMPPMPWDKGIKGKLYMWMVYWPISGAWVLVHKPLEYFFDWAYAFTKVKMATLSFAIFKAHIGGE